MMIINYFSEVIGYSYMDQNDIDLRLPRAAGSS